MLSLTIAACNICGLQIFTIFNVRILILLRSNVHYTFSKNQHVCVVGYFRVAFDCERESCINVAIRRKPRLTFAVQHQKENTTYSTVIDPNAELNAMENQGIVLSMQLNQQMQSSRHEKRTEKIKLY